MEELSQLASKEVIGREKEGAGNAQWVSQQFNRRGKRRENRVSLEFRVRE